MADGTLSHVAAASRRAQKSKELLGLSKRGVQKPQTGPPPVAPADSRGPQTAPQPAQGEEGVSPEVRAQMLERVKPFLNQMQAGGQGAVQGSPVAATPLGAGATTSIDERVRRSGGTKLPAEQQYYRIAGRAGSPREIAIFSARLLAEQQLGRPPTTQELKQFIFRPEAVSPAFPSAFEAPEEV